MGLGGRWSRRRFLCDPAEPRRFHQCDGGRLQWEMDETDVFGLIVREPVGGSVMVCCWSRQGGRGDQGAVGCFGRRPDSRCGGRAIEGDPVGD